MPIIDAQHGTGTGKHHETNEPLSFPIVVLTTELDGNILSNAFLPVDAYHMTCKLIEAMANLGSPWAVGMVHAHNGIIRALQI